MNPALRSDNFKSFPFEQVQGHHLFCRFSEEGVILSLKMYKSKMITHVEFLFVWAANPAFICPFEINRICFLHLNKLIKWEELFKSMKMKA